MFQAELSEYDSERFILLPRVESVDEAIQIATQAAQDYEFGASQVSVYDRYDNLIRRRDLA